MHVLCARVETRVPWSWPLQANKIVTPAHTLCYPYAHISCGMRKIWTRGCSELFYCLWRTSRPCQNLCASNWLFNILWPGGWTCYIGGGGSQIGTDNEMCVRAHYWRMCVMLLCNFIFKILYIGCRYWWWSCNWSSWWRDISDICVLWKEAGVENGLMLSAAYFTTFSKYIAVPSCYSSSIMSSSYNHCHLLCQSHQQSKTDKNFCVCTVCTHNKFYFASKKK